MNSPLYLPGEAWHTAELLSMITHSAAKCVADISDMSLLDTVCWARSHLLTIVHYNML